jgi:hypothetical protein
MPGEDSMAADKAATEARTSAAEFEGHSGGTLISELPCASTGKQNRVEQADDPLSGGTGHSQTIANPILRSRSGAGAGPRRAHVAAMHTH